MTENDNERIIQIHMALFGLPDTESKGLVGQVNAMAEAIGTLPCEHNMRRLKSLETWSESHDSEITENTKFRSQSGLKLWHGVILLGVNAVMLLITALMLRAGL